MKRIAVFGVVIATALGVTPQAIAAQDLRHERVSFKVGASSGTVTGSIRAEETIDCLLGAHTGKTVTAEKNNDTWSIGVDDFYFYTIPEIVIVGD